MAQELAFVLINPYTITKSRTGGVIARCIGRTDLNLVGARMFGPSHNLVQQYSELVRRADPDQKEACGLIADYILKSYSPIPKTGKSRRVMLLLFEGEDAIRKIWQVTGSAMASTGTGETIRDTYGDYVTDDRGKMVYFEPAVLVGPRKERVAATLKLWARYAKSDGGMVEAATDVQAGENVEKTVVLIKPDNFRYPSPRPGSIIDMLSMSGLRIVAINKFCMSVAQAEEFYGPVRDALKKKFRDIGAARAGEVLAREFGIEVPDESLDELARDIGPLFAKSQFESIVKFMTGFRPSEISPEQKKAQGKEGCLALVYEGVNAVKKIRNLLGPTDPSKAGPGSIRREFGSDIMVNAAHASDSTENAEREMKIIRIVEDNITPYVEKHYGSVDA